MLVSSTSIETGVPEPVKATSCPCEMTFGIVTITPSPSGSTSRCVKPSFGEISVVARSNAWSRVQNTVTVDGNGGMGRRPTTGRSHPRAGRRLHRRAGCRTTLPADQ